MFITKKIVSVTLLGIFLTITSVAKAEWSSFLGPNNNDQVTTGKSYSKDVNQWPQNWKTKIGLGYSAISLSGNLAFTMSHDGKETGTVHCLNSLTGKTIGEFTYQGPLMDTFHKGGPNATPTIDGEFVYAVSKAGSVFCLNKKDGTLKWQQELPQLMNIEMPAYGFASSPVIHGNKVLFTSGRAIALDKHTGKLIWLSKTVSKDEAAYHPGHATPVIFTLNQTDYLTFLLGTGLEILRLNDGSFVTRHNLSATANMTVTTPTVFESGRKIFLSWNRYSQMLDFDGVSLTSSWKKKDFIQTMQNNILIDGVIYGTNGKDRGKRTSLMALDAQTGKTLWNEKGFKWSQITVIDDHLLCLTIEGDLKLVKVSRSGYNLLSERKLVDNKCWTKITFANGNLFIRSIEGDILSLKMQ